MNSGPGERGRCDVHWDMNELDEVTNETHDTETYGDRLAYLSEFCSRRSGRELKNAQKCAPCCEGFVHRVRNWEHRGLKKSARRVGGEMYLVSVTGKLLGYFEEFGDSVGHGSGRR